MQKKSISIIGSGAWGSALAIALSVKFDSIYLITKDIDETKKIKKQHPVLNITFADNIIITDDINKISETNCVLITTPSTAFSEVLKNITPLISKNTFIAWGTKGFDIKNSCFLSQTFTKIMPNHQACVISGPTFAKEIANKHPSAIMVASKDKNVRDYWQENISTKYIYAHTTDDIIGVELGGCIKNVLAIATGISYGLNFGANTQTVIITKGIQEMKKLGLVLGAKEKTLQGLSGTGDLILTCSNMLSRNYRFGKELANSENIEEAIKNVGATVEGYNTIKLLLDKALEKGVKIPICETIFAVIENKKSAKNAIMEIVNNDTYIT